MMMSSRVRAAWQELDDALKAIGDPEQCLRQLQRWMRETLPATSVVTRNAIRPYAVDEFVRTPVADLPMHRLALDEVLRRASFHRSSDPQRLGEFAGTIVEYLVRYVHLDDACAECQYDLVAMRRGDELQLCCMGAGHAFHVTTSSGKPDLEPVGKRDERAVQPADRAFLEGHAAIAQNLWTTASA